MKKIFAILLALVMLLSLTACGGEKEEDPNAGRYEGVNATVMGFTMPITDILSGETWVELETGGRGTIMLDSDDFPLKWSVDGEEITITIDGEDSVGTLVDGVITIELLDMDCEMTFAKEGSTVADEPEALAPTYNDVGYWVLVRIDGATAEESTSEEDMALLQSLGVAMYLELLEDGTGVMCMEEELALTWEDGTVHFTEDNMSLFYTLENDELALDMLESKLVFRKGEKPEPVVSELEKAGFTEYMEVGVSYAFTNQCYENEEYETTGEATVVSYEIFESAEGYEAMEGYEWRVVKMEIRFFDENAWDYGIKGIGTNWEDYYNTKLHDDSSETVEQTDTYDKDIYTVIYNGEKMDVYGFSYYPKWGEWYAGEDSDHECINYKQWAFQVPVGYDGCVVGIRDARVEWPEDCYITDMNPEDFLLFRLN